MRIVGGSAKGRRLQVPEGVDVRPTSEMVREAVFNKLAHGVDDFDLRDVSVLDLFCGSGALGIEALSRGAVFATFADVNGAALLAARKNAANAGFARQILTLRLDARHLAPPPRAAHAPVGLCFLDPPYGKELLPPALLGLASKGWLAAGCVVVVERGGEERDLEPPRHYEAIDEREYGRTRIAFLRYLGD